MKKQLILLISILLILLSGCKSKKQAAVQQPEPVAREEPAWQNVQMPVTVNIEQPMRMALNGIMTMVRGEYLLVSFRTFGFEVATACITPEQMDMVMKMPSKMWLSEPLAERFKKSDNDFTQLQEAMLSNNLRLPKLADGINISTGGTAENPLIAVDIATKGSKIAMTISYSLADARWNVPNPARFSTPGSGYQKQSLRSAAKLLGN